ncbi:unnamed protein product [Paramecium sonneborni]|uniref:Transmembrane protein n=1 Tax=Paramecium sonneborni TaxID=65129 RepID=A0A8S1RM05_9CILI|nr:unnamed protein product [Paramecium sonneborni]
MLQITYHKLKNIFRCFQDSLNQQILSIIDITKDSEFLQSLNFLQRLKILHIKKLLLSQMLYQISKHLWIFIQIIQILFLVFREQLTQQDQKVFDYFSQQFLNSSQLKELDLLKAMQIFQQRLNTKHIKAQMIYLKLD